MSQPCSCPERAMCEYTGGPCERPAEWSVLTPPGRWIKTFPHGRLHFMCTPCKDYYVAAIKKPLKGIDRPEGVAPEDWKPSIMDHLRHAQIAIAFEERQERERLQAAIPTDEYVPTFVRHYTPAQLKQWSVLRRYHHDNPDARR